MPATNSTITITLEAATEKANAKLSGFFNRLNSHINSANAKGAARAPETSNNASRSSSRSREAEDQTGLIENIEAAWQRFYDKVANTSKDLANQVVAPFEGLQEGIDKAMNELLLKGGGAKQFFNGVAVSILTSMRKAFSEMVADFVTKILMMGVEWAVRQAAMTAIFLVNKQAQTAASAESQMTMVASGKAIAAAGIAAQAPLAAAASAIWAAPATLATIATFGAAALAAPGEISLASSETMAASLAGFAEGGFTGAGPRSEVAGLVHRGEFVVPAERVNQLGLGFFEALRSGRFSAASINALSAPHASDFQPGPGGPVIQHKTELSLATFGGEADAKRWAEGQDGETWFLNMMNRHAYRYAQQG